MVRCAQGWLFALALLVALPGLAADQDKRCTSCHDEMEAKPVLSIYQTRHGVKADRRTPSCQSCHGASEAHANTPPKSRRFPPTEVNFKPGVDAAVANQACLACHQKGASAYWPGSQHERQGLACSSCHTTHAARDPALEKSRQAKACFECHGPERARFMMPSNHLVSTGRQVCSDCHNVHGSHGPKLLKADNLNDLCYTCHAEKRGPFLWEHAPASEDCGACHTAHGSANRPLLKMRSPWLCQQCHSSARHPGTAYSASSGANTSIGASLNNTIQLPMHGCANCHSQVHGSNHPGGARLIR